MIEMVLTSAATSTPTSTPVSSDIPGTVTEIVNSSQGVKEKTGFLVNYLVSQREVLSHMALDFLSTVFIALLVFFVGRRLIHLFGKLMNSWMKKAQVEESVHRFSLSLTKTVLNVILIFIVAGILGVGGSTIIAIIGSAGLAIGLALQGSLSNFAGGFLILLLKPFRVGDYIVTSGVEGTVKSIDIFYTHIVTTDNKRVVVPNGIVSNSNVINNTLEPYRMLVLDFMVPHDTDINVVRETVLGDMIKLEDICQDKDMAVLVDRLYPGRIKLIVRAWVETPNFVIAKSQVNEMIMDGLQKKGITII